jgi:hypothetical protein
MSIIDYSRRVINDSRVMFQLVASLIIVIYDHHIFIVPTTDVIMNVLIQTVPL